MTVAAILTAPFARSESGEQAVESKSSPTYDDSEKWKQNCYLKDDGDACLDYADYYLEKYYDFRSSQVAIEYGCKKGNKNCCDRLKDHDAEGEKIRVKCETGDARSCYHYAHGMQKIHDRRDKAIEYAKKGCRLEPLPWCDQAPYK
jgi:hypothetical protein